MTGATILGGIAGPDLTAAERDFFRAADPWGFILFGRNIDTPERLRRLTADLRAAVGRDAPVLIDQEGGRVQRMRAPHWTDWPAPLDQAANGDRAIWLHHHLMARELQAMGIDADCAPVLDIARDDTHPFLKNRCLGADAATVTRLGRIAADAMLAAGVLPVVKHMPGHGRARVDSHKDLPVVDAPLAELMATDFAPFRALADLPKAERAAPGRLIGQSRAQVNKAIAAAAVIARCTSARPTQTPCEMTPPRPRAIRRPRATRS